MSDKLPIFGDDILTPRSVASTAKGIDDATQVFNQGLALAHDVGKMVNQDESSAMLYAQSSTVAEAKQDFLLATKKNPDPTAVSNAYKLYEAKTKALYQSSPLTTKDAHILRKQIDDDSLDAQRVAAVNNLEQARLQQQISLSDNFSKSLSQISTNFFTNPDLAYEQAKNTQGMLNSFVKNGTISVEAYQKYNDLINRVVSRNQSLLSRFPQLDARGYHTMTAFTQPPTPTDGSTAPRLGVTADLHNSLNSDMNYHDAVALAQQGKIDNGVLFYAVSKMTDDQYNKFLLSLDGIADAQGQINSDHPYGVLQNRYDYLSSAKGDNLTVKEQAERDQIGYFINGLKQDYLGTMKRTPHGQEIDKEYLDSQAAIMVQPTNLETKQEQLAANTNQYVNKMVNYGHAMGIPSELIKPFPKQMVQTVENGFVVGADPNVVLTPVRGMSKTNAAFLAASLNNPIQAETILTSSLLQGKDNTGMSSIFVEANQKGQDFSALVMDKDTVTEKDLRGRIYSQLSSTLNYLSTQSGGASRVAGMIDMVENTAKYLALQNGDFKLKNYKDYIAKAANAIEQAYPIKTGPNYTFNLNQADMSDADAQSVASYMLETATNSQVKKGRSALEVSYDFNTAGAHVVMSPDGFVQVVDQYGTVYASEPYSSTLLDAARHVSGQRLEKNKKSYQEQQRLTSIGLPYVGGVAEAITMRGNK